MIASFPPNPNQLVFDYIDVYVKDPSNAWINIPIDFNKYIGYKIYLHLGNVTFTPVDLDIRVMNGVNGVTLSGQVFNVQNTVITAETPESTSLGVKLALVGYQDAGGSIEIFKRTSSNSGGIITGSIMNKSTTPGDNIAWISNYYAGASNMSDIRLQLSSGTISAGYFAKVFGYIRI